MIKGNWANLKNTIDIDKEIERLCAALNSIPGVQTTESCCGHGKHPVRIWFNVNGVKALSLILWAGCFRWWHWEGDGWNLKLNIADPHRDERRIIRLLLVSKNKGRQAYNDANSLSKRILKFYNEWIKLKKHVRNVERGFIVNGKLRLDNINWFIDEIEKAHKAASKSKLVFDKGGK